MTPYHCTWKEPRLKTTGSMRDGKVCQKVRVSMGVKILHWGHAVRLVPYHVHTSLSLVEGVWAGRCPPGIMEHKRISPPSSSREYAWRVFLGCYGPIAQQEVFPRHPPPDTQHPTTFPPMQSFRDEVAQRFRAVQDHICAFLDAENGVRYHEDAWTYEKGDGGGRTRVYSGGDLLEKGGVNFSALTGASLPASAATAFKIPDGTPFFATGVSLVMHPHNPLVPTIHLNIRYFEAGDVHWFGGGVDLTPFYPEEDRSEER